MWSIESPWLIMLEAIGVLLVGVLVGLWFSRRQQNRRTPPRRLSLLAVVSVSIAHIAAFTTLFSTAFALGDAGKEVPWHLGGALAVLQAPFMYLLYLDPSYFGNRWWGDDSNLILGLSLLNAILWGLCAAWLFSHWRQRTAA